jgi:peptidoglycan/LPS O-acetylase OafA/YrhL
LKSKVYFENLDGLRAIAAFAVLLYHTSNWLPRSSNILILKLKNIISFNEHGGHYGVVFFFVLSGFLITYLLLNEREKFGSISLSKFYLRRILRIWPLYYFTVIIGFVVYPTILSLFHYSHQESANPFMYALFLANFDNIYNHMPTAGILGVQWSVAIEEQFYLIWPLFFLNKNIIKVLPYVFILMIFSSTYFYLKQSSWETQNYHFGSCIRFLSWGGLTGYCCFYHSQFLSSFLNRIPRFINPIIYLICLFLLFENNTVLFIWQKIRNIHILAFLLNYFIIFLPMLFFSYVIIDQNFSNRSFFKIGKYGFLTSMGKVSYGIYLLHMICIYLVMKISLLAVQDLYLINISIVTLTTIGLSLLSYRYFEKFFLSKKPIR